MAHNEVWVFRPNQRSELTGKPFDARAAIGPVLALRHLRPFKWLLFGDDDIAFFWPGVLQALAKLDPDDPYFLSDAWYSALANMGAEPPLNMQPAQPRCLPCTYDTRGINITDEPNILFTCNCTATAMAAFFREKLARLKRFPELPPVHGMVGAGGAIISIGLLRRINASAYEQCLLRPRKLNMTRDRCVALQCG
eukprot:scaffold10.g2433.t1